MQLASLHSVFKTFLILILLYYVLKVLTRLFGPLLLRYVTKKVGQKFNSRFNDFANTTKSNDNDPIIKSKTNQKSSNKDDGEYIDFEEID